LGTDEPDFRGLGQLVLLLRFVSAAPSKAEDQKAWMADQTDWADSGNPEFQRDPSLYFLLLGLRPEHPNREIRFSGEGQRSSGFNKKREVRRKRMPA
jgi:hypothetical protein